MEVAEAHIVELAHAGDRLRFTTDALPGRVFDARITWVSDALDPQTRTVDARVEVKNEDQRLRPGMFADAVIRVPAGVDVRVGDWIAFGISHPCTAFDKWHLLPIVDAEYRVIDVARTYF